MSDTIDPVYSAYLAAQRPKPYPRTKRHTPAARVRRAILDCAGAHCAICHSRTRLRLAALSGAAWDAAVAAKGHTALLSRATKPARIALYAAAAASPRVRAYCPACTPAARIRRHLEALNAAAHGPHSRYTL